jgi:hypothetical protein
LSYLVPVLFGVSGSCVILDIWFLCYLGYLVYCVIWVLLSSLQQELS